MNLIRLLRLNSELTSEMKKILKQEIKKVLDSIGIDIEIIEEFSAILAKKLFNEDELSYIAGNVPSRKKSEMQ